MRKWWAVRTTLELFSVVSLRNEVTLELSLSNHPRKGVKISCPFSSKDLTKPPFFNFDNGIGCPEDRVTSESREKHPSPSPSSSQSSALRSQQQSSVKLVALPKLQLSFPQTYSPQHS